MSTMCSRSRSLETGLCCILQIDLRFSSRDQGNLAVVVAPVLRFIDVGFNADVRIEVCALSAFLAEASASSLRMGLSESCASFL